MVAAERDPTESTSLRPQRPVGPRSAGAMDAEPASLQKRGLGIKSEAACGEAALSVLGFKFKFK